MLTLKFLFWKIWFLIHQVKNNIILLNNEENSKGNKTELIIITLPVELL